MSLVVDTKITGAKPRKHWETYILRRIKRNKNFLGFFSGATGSGKSWSCLRAGENLDPNFNINQVVFSVKELFDLINSGKLNRGSVIVFEESGVGANARQWFSKFNKALNYLVQTFRHEGFILLINSPLFEHVDSAVRKLFHAEMQTMRIDIKNKRVILKPQLIQYNGRLKKFYYKRLRVVTRGGTAPVNTWSVGKPSKELLRAYEIRKKAFTTALNLELSNELSGISNKALTFVQSDILDRLKEGHTVKEIAKVREVTPRAILLSMDYIRKKGYKLIEVRSKDAKHVFYNVKPP